MEYGLLSGEPKEDTEMNKQSIISVIRTWFKSVLDFVIKPPVTVLDIEAQKMRLETEFNIQATSSRNLGV